MPQLPAVGNRQTQLPEPVAQQIALANLAQFPQRGEMQAIGTVGADPGEVDGGFRVQPGGGFGAPPGGTGQGTGRRFRALSV